MSEKGITPGKWRTERLYVVSSETGAVVADCDHSGLTPPDVKFANARVISKVPEMLELLRACEVVMREDHPATAQLVARFLREIDGGSR